MVGKTAFALIVAGGVSAAMVAVQPASAAPISPVNVVKDIGTQVDPASFWGLPFPYGYAYRSGSCVRYVRVQTASGPRWRRVWVCGGPAVLDRRG
jgi:hypothetical protein